jgi:fatty-acyl-CoA synthase
MLEGLMMETPLTLTHLFWRMGRYFPGQRVITKTTEGTHRYTLADHGLRTARLASALQRIGVRPGERVATLGWNTYRHFEVYFAAPCMGAVLHTVNFRLHPEQIVHVMNHAEDAVVFVDASIYPLLAKIRPALRTVREIIVMDDLGNWADQDGTLEYEAFLESGESDFAWPSLPENTAAGLCYTSGTTGNPKACLYSHRSLVLHGLGVGTSGVILTDRDRVLSIVPMFHVNAWGFPFAVGLTGSELVFPSRFMQPQELAGLIESEKVTYLAGVPTIMAGILQAVRAQGNDVSSVRQATVGGAALSRSLIEGFDQLGIPILQGWGMTETSPVASLGLLRAHMEDWTEEEKLTRRLKQGPALPFVEMRIVDEDGHELPWDGKASGELQVRGPWVIREYYQEPRNAESFAAGWFRTGDVATIDALGYVQLVDRVKDLVKSGGEWISSVDLENAIMGNPKVAEAAVIAASHPKWTERPLACVVKADPTLTRDELLDGLRGVVADWWLPDDVLFLDEIPKTSVGKFDKKVLRAQYGDHLITTNS